MRKDGEIGESNEKALHELSKGAMIATVFGIIGYGLGFLFRVCAAKYFGPHDFGIFALAETIQLVAVTFITLGIPAGIARYLPIYLEKREFRTVRGYLNFAFLMPLLFSLLITGLMFYFAPEIQAFFNFPDIFINVIRIVALILPFRVINNVLRKIFIAKKKILYQEIALNVFEKGSYLIGTILVIILGLGVIWMIVAMLASVVISCIYCIITYKLKINFDLSGERNYRLKSWLTFSIPLFFSGIFAHFIGWCDNIVISKLSEPEQLGIYSVAFSASVLLTFFLVSFCSIFLPLISEAFARNEHTKITFLYKKAQVWIFLLSFPIYLVMLLYAEFVLGLIFGQAYVAGKIAFIILATGLLVKISCGPAENILILHKKTVFIFWNNVFVATINIVMNIVLIMKYGITGAAIASATSFVLMNSILLWKASKCERIEFDYPCIIKSVIAGSTAIVIAILVPSANWLWLVLAGAIYGITYVVLLFLFKTFKEEDYNIMIAVGKKIGVNISFLRKF